MNRKTESRKGPDVRIAVALSAVMGLAVGSFATHSLATTSVPTEHKGLAVKTAGVISSKSMSKQVGLEGYKLQLREITIAPGGQIAKHDHSTRPGLVKVISGTWTEGRPDGEEEFAASAEKGILEHEDTVHWFFNRGSEPATAIVCDIVPDK